MVSKTQCWKNEMLISREDDTATDNKTISVMTIVVSSCYGDYLTFSSIRSSTGGNWTGYGRTGYKRRIRFISKTTASFSNETFIPDFPNSYSLGGSFTTYRR